MIQGSAPFLRSGLLHRNKALLAQAFQRKICGKSASMHVFARNRICLTQCRLVPVRHPITGGPIKPSLVGIKQTSSSGAASANSIAKPPPFSLAAVRTVRRRWVWLALLLKYTRIPVLVLAVYGLGHQQGIIDSCNNPTETRRTLLESTLMDFGARRMEEYNEETQESRRHYDWKKEPDDVYATVQMKRIARIARAIVNVAKEYVKEQMDRVATNIRAELPNEESLQDALKKDETFQHWNTAMNHLEGYWTFCLLHSEIPNACVTEELPKHIFVTTSMLNPETMLSDDDEVAMLLGHEISHLIHGHSTKGTQLEKNLRVAEIFLLSIDPTAGILSAIFILALATARTAVSASHSRQHEREADALGLQLAARACFDTQKGANFLSKLDDYEKGLERGSISQGGSSIGARQSFLSFTHSHPPSEERYETLLKAAEEVNANKYCATVRKRMFEALFTRKGA